MDEVLRDFNQEKIFACIVEYTLSSYDCLDNINKKIENLYENLDAVKVKSEKCIRNMHYFSYRKKNIFMFR